MALLTPDTPPANAYICRRLYIPAEPTVIALVNGALSTLLQDNRYEQYGQMSPEDTVQMFQEMWLSYIESDVCMLGMIVPFASATVPPGCLECDGAIYQRAEYPRLYARLHPALIVNADEFRTPDLTGQFVLGGTGDFGGHPAHQTGGESQVTLTTEQMPAHSHSSPPHSHLTHDHNPVPTPAAIAIPPDIALTASPHVPASTASSGVVIESAGGGQPHNNMPPYYTLRYCIIAR